jgi:hypothetical protein
MEDTGTGMNLMVAPKTTLARKKNEILIGSFDTNKSKKESLNSTVYVPKDQQTEINSKFIRKTE